MFETYSEYCSVSSLGSSKLVICGKSLKIIKLPIFSNKLRKLHYYPEIAENCTNLHTRVLMTSLNCLNSVIFILESECLKIPARDGSHAAHERLPWVLFPQSGGVYE